MSPRPAPRMQDMSPEEVRVRADMARKFLEVASMVADDESDESLPSVAGALCVLAAHRCLGRDVRPRAAPEAARTGPRPSCRRPRRHQRRRGERVSPATPPRRQGHVAVRHQLRQQRAGTRHGTPSAGHGRRHGGAAEQTLSRAGGTAPRNGPLATALRLHPGARVPPGPHHRRSPDHGRPTVRGLRYRAVDPRPRSPRLEQDERVSLTPRWTAGNRAFRFFLRCDLFSPWQLLAAGLFDGPA